MRWSPRRGPQVSNPVLKECLWGDQVVAVFPAVAARPAVLEAVHEPLVGLVVAPAAAVAPVHPIVAADPTGPAPMALASPPFLRPAFL